MNISESVHRILGDQESLADLFYSVFLDHYPEVRRHFQGVDLKYQAVLLSMALLVMERHCTASYSATETYLKYLGTKHCTRGVPAELFPYFRDALLATLEQFHGSDWDAGLARQWREAIARATETMLEGYKQHFTV
jgi:hemoglobin-like flavoprotein